jgi:hypothetical protein
VLRIYARHGDGFMPRTEIAEMFSATLTADEVDAVINAGLVARVFVEEAPRGPRPHRETRGLRPRPLSNPPQQGGGLPGVARGGWARTFH